MTADDKATLSTLMTEAVQTEVKAIFQGLSQLQYKMYQVVDSAIADAARGIVDDFFRGAAVPSGASASERNGDAAAERPAEHNRDQAHAV
jgi:hypothetical protein